MASEVGAGEELVGLGVLQTAGDLGRGLVEGGSPACAVVRACKET